MPVHDWSRVESAIFHSFHLSWVATLHGSLNSGLLPDGYYALIEQHFGRVFDDLMTLDTRRPEGGISDIETPPRVRHAYSIDRGIPARRRSIAIRHVNGHRLVALLEMVSPASKDQAKHVQEFAAKAIAALDHVVNLLLIDLFSSGAHDSHGMHGAIEEILDPEAHLDEVPADEPFTLAAFVAGPRIEVYREQVAVGATLPEMPLFIQPDRYVNVPLESTYQSAYRGMPAFWRNVLEGRKPETA